MKKFEYKLLTIGFDSITEEEPKIELSQRFNKWGAEGWDLVKLERVAAASLFRGSGATVGFFAIFKRELK